MSNIRIGDKIKFVSVEEYYNNMIKSGRTPKKTDISIQEQITGKIAEVIEIETIPNSNGTIVYHTKYANNDKSLYYFLPQRFMKMNNINLSDDLFEF